MSFIKYSRFLYEAFILLPQETWGVKSPRFFEPHSALNRTSVLGREVFLGGAIDCACKATFTSLRGGGGGGGEGGASDKKVSISKKRRHKKQRNDLPSSSSATFPSSPGTGGAG
jgi:hypothetical protein